MIASAAARYGIPTALAMAQANAESGYNPNAVSSAGAGGVMQLMPATAASLGVTDVFDPVQNIDAGFRYLASLYKQFGDWALALAAYNAGPGNVAKYGGVPPFAETQNYVSTVLTGAGSIATSPIVESVGSDSSGDSVDSSGGDSGVSSGVGVVGLGIGIALLTYMVMR